MKCLLRKSDKAPLSETFTVGCWSEVVASRSLVKNMLTCYECEAGPCCCIRISNAQREKENSRGFKCENRNESLWQDDNLSECTMVPTLRSTTPCNNNAWWCICSSIFHIIQMLMYRLFMVFKVQIEEISLHPACDDFAGVIVNAHYIQISFPLMNMNCHQVQTCERSFQFDRWE